MRRLGRRLAALPGRAKAALVLAVMLTIGLVVALAVGAGDGGEGDDASDGPAAGTGTGMPSTTLATGGIDIDAPEGWQAIPVPDLGVGVAVPPGWEAVLLSPEGLATLSNASPAVPDFADNARAAAGAGGVLYAAGEEAAGGVSDLVVRAAPETGVADADDLVAYAEDLADDGGRRDPQVEVVDGAERPTVRLRFRVGGGGEVAEGTETLVLGPRDIVWSLVVTSDDASVHGDLVGAITGTLAFAPG
ncbi:MAG TPA: hypothetical protein VFZ79_09140 [Acidimicrobiales bacterium]